MNRARHLARRHRADLVFYALGRAAIALSALSLVALIAIVLPRAYDGFTRTQLTLRTLPLHAVPADAALPQLFSLTNEALARGVAPPPQDAAQRAALQALGGFFAAQEVKRQRQAWDGTPADLPARVTLSDYAEQLFRQPLRADATPRERLQREWIGQWAQAGDLTRQINPDFFIRGDSRAPEAAGFLASVVGSLLVLAVAMGLSIPIAIGTAVTLQEFARPSRVSTALEVLINNLAAVPSILYGLLGVTVFVQLIGVARSTALAGGLTLAMLVLPVMIISARAAIRAVPPGMRQAALALGATRLQVVRHHVLPYALPAIMTGIILSVCRVLGETAPLMLIGMIAFVADIPTGLFDPATTMPVQIYIWATSAEAGFAGKTAAGIVVLLCLLLLLNALAISVRRRSQLHWS